MNPMKLMIPATLACTYAFMLPAATPPNAIVFSYGHLKVLDMVSILDDLLILSSMHCASNLILPSILDDLHILVSMHCASNIILQSIYDDLHILSSMHCASNLIGNLLSLM